MNNFTRDKIVRAGFLISVAFIFLSFTYAALIYNQLPPLIPLYNQLPWGIQRLADRIMIFLPVLINGIMFSANIVFAKYIYDKMPLVVRMVSVTTLFIGFMVFVFILRTTILVL